MCGLIRQSSDRKDLQRRYPFADFSEVISFPPPRYNAAPTQSLLVIRPTAEGRAEIVPLTWGLVPSWTAELRSIPAAINASLTAL
jgi:putative SOS response-associated peptidase YedK